MLCNVRTDKKTKNKTKDKGHLFVIDIPREVDKFTAAKISFHLFFLLFWSFHLDGKMCLSVSNVALNQPLPLSAPSHPLPHQSSVSYPCTFTFAFQSKESFLLVDINLKMYITRSFALTSLDFLFRSWVINCFIFSGALHMWHTFFW